MSALAENVVLVTGANRGIGLALVKALLRQGAKKVYAAARNKETLQNLAELGAYPLSVDITQDSSILEAEKVAKDVTILINNAGVLARGSILTNSLEDIEKEMNTNFYGALKMVRAFSPVIASNGGGNIANLLSICSYAGMPGLGGYCASKAALYIATQCLRLELAQQSIMVHGVFPGPVATEMNKDLDIEMADEDSVVQEIIEGILKGKSEIFPDAISKQVSETWSQNPAAIAEEFSAY